MSENGESWGDAMKVRDRARAGLRRRARLIAAGGAISNYTGKGTLSGIRNSGSVTLTHTRVRSNTPDNCAPRGTITGCAG